MTKATAPIDLLREFRAGFEAEATAYNAGKKYASSEGELRAMSAKAYAAEQAVKKIDATLRDWA